MELPPTDVPGALNPAVTQESIDSTICHVGWTQTIRPPSTYTTKLKLRQLHAAGILGQADRYEEDHLVPLELGGAAADPRNLWPEAREGDWTAAMKDRLENLLHRFVCAGNRAHRMPLAKAQAVFLGNWIDGYRTFIGNPYPQ